MGTGAVTNQWYFQSCNLGGGFTVLLDIPQIYATFTPIIGVGTPFEVIGWFNNWYIRSRDSQVASTGGDEQIVIQGEGGGVAPNNYGIRFAGPSTGNSVIDAYTGNNLVPTIWIHTRNFQNGLAGPLGQWYESPDDGPGVISDYGNGTPGNNFSNIIGTTLNAALGWFPSTQSYVAAPKPNSSGVIAGFNITGINNAVSFGTFNPLGFSTLEDYAYIEIQFVQGEFASGGTFGGRVSRDISPINLIKVTRNTVTCPGSLSGTAEVGKGPYGADWTTILDPADYIPITNVSYFRLRTHIHVQALEGAGGGGIGNPEIEIPAERFKIGAQLYILWDQ